MSFQTFMCQCGKVTFEAVAGGKLAITSEGGIVTATIVNEGESAKLEHLQCGTCRTVLLDAG